MANRKENARNAEEERKHFLRVVQAFKNYPLDSKDRIRRTKTYLREIPAEHQTLLSNQSYMDHLAGLVKHIQLNTEITNHIIEDAENMFDNEVLPPSV